MMGQAAMTGDKGAGQAAARRSADRLALALEEVGFDVGQEFPVLHDAMGRRGSAVVRIGDVQPAVADRLASALTRQRVGYLAVLPPEFQLDVDRAEDELRSQAEKVSAWIEVRKTFSGARELAFHIHNASGMPVYDVELPLPRHAGDEEARTESVGLVPPGRTVERPAPAEWLKTYVEPEPAKVEFVDSAGRRWSRDERGRLSRAD
jgi:hypothetical protein